jgi:hypothetical protein
VTRTLVFVDNHEKWISLSATLVGRNSTALPPAPYQTVEFAMTLANMFLGLDRGGPR